MRLPLRPLLIHGAALLFRKLKGNNVKKITSEYNVQIKFPEKADKAKMNGDVKGETNGHQENNSSSIKISGRKENCDAAAKALKALVPINIQVR